MRLTDLTTISLIQKAVPIEVPIFVHNHRDKSGIFFDRGSIQSAAEVWNILVIQMEEGWTRLVRFNVCDLCNIVKCVTTNTSQLQGYCQALLSWSVLITRIRRNTSFTSWYRRYGSSIIEYLCAGLLTVMARTWWTRVGIERDRHKRLFQVVCDEQTFDQHALIGSS